MKAKAIQKALQRVLWHIKREYHIRKGESFGDIRQEVAFRGKREALPCEAGLPVPPGGWDTEWFRLTPDGRWVCAKCGQDHLMARVAAEELRDTQQQDTLTPAAFEEPEKGVK